MKREPICPKCGTEKVYYGNRMVCKPCAKVRANAWTHANRDRATETNRRSRDRNRTAIREGAKRRYWADPEKARSRNRLAKLAPDYKEKSFWQHQWRTYRLTRDQWEQLFTAQGSCCGICRADQPGSRNRWHTDHDHAVGPRAVRGILCQRCNIMLGAARDQVSTLLAAIPYLEKSRC